MAKGLKESDFIEIEFTARTKDGEIFDTNMKKDIRDEKLKSKAKPFVFCLGQKLFLKGVEDFLIGKPVGEYEINLPAEKAFGKRKTELIRKIPMKVFQEQNINPVPGVMFDFDGMLAKILTVSGGRVIVDFNNPVAGKDVTYKINVLRKIEDLKEKIKAFNEFLFKKNFDFEVKDKKIMMKVEKPMINFVEMFKNKFREVFDLDLEVEEAKEKKKDSKEKEKSA